MVFNTGISRSIDEPGRITIPKSVRASLDIQGGDTLDIFIDDKNVGGFLGWGEILNIIDPWAEREEEALKAIKSRKFRLFSKK